MSSPTGESSSGMGTGCSVQNDFSLVDIRDALRTAPRQGAATDEPQGSRYISLSDTIATAFADRLDAEILKEHRENGP